MKQPLIILTGPTAVGKTALSIQLAKTIGGEIISADSMQVYRGMDIGTAKITSQEMEGVPHHLIDILEPSQEFNVYQFRELALEAMKGIYERGHIPIIAGGTGFYIQSVLYDISFTESEVSTEYRDSLYQIAEQQGAKALHSMLRQVDPVSADGIHANNIKRVARALEYFHQTGELMSQHNATQKEKESPYRFAYFVLNDDRDALYQRINLRVEQMLEKGLLEEVSQLRSQGYTKDMVSMKAIGYKEILDYLDGLTTYEEAVDILKRDTRHFAKRQLTWFAREKDTIFIQIDQLPEKSSQLDHMLTILNEKSIL